MLFFFLIFKIFPFTPGFEQFDCDVSWCMYFTFLVVVVCEFLRSVGLEVSSHLENLWLVFFQFCFVFHLPSLFLGLGTPITCLLVHLKLCHSSLMHFLFSFLGFILASFFCCAVKFSSSMLILPLIPSSVFFISDLVFFILRRFGSLKNIF